MKKEISLADYLLDEEEYSQDIYKEENMGNKNLDYNTDYYGEPNTGKNPLFVHYGASHFDTNIQPITNDAIMNKPRGGFWGSRVNDDYGWHAWNIEEQYMDCRPENKILFRLKPKTKIMVIDSNEKYQAIIKKYKMDTAKVAERMGLPVSLANMMMRGEGMLDFEKIAERYDALVVTFNGTHQMRRNLEFWDCNSIVVFNQDAIEEVKQKDILEKDMYKFVRQNPGTETDHWTAVLNTEKVNMETLEHAKPIPKNIDGIPVKISETLLRKCKNDIQILERCEGISIKEKNMER